MNFFLVHRFYIRFEFPPETDQNIQLVEILTKINNEYEDPYFYSYFSFMFVYSLE